MIKILITLASLSQIAITAPPRALFLDSLWSPDTWGFLVDPLVDLGTGFIKDFLMPSIPPTPSNQDNVAIPNELRSNRQFLEDIKESIQNLSSEIISYLQQADLNKTFEEIRALWNEMTSLLLTYNKGEFENEDDYKEVSRNLQVRIRENIYLNIEKIDFDNKAFPYFENIQQQMIQNKVDIFTYSAKLSVIIKDFAMHCSHIIDLLNFASLIYPDLKDPINKINEDLRKIQRYQKQHVSGSWFQMVQYLSEGGDESYFTEKVLQIFGRTTHIIHLSQTGFGASRGFMTSLRITTVPDADIGDVSVFLDFEIEGVWSRLCASGDPLTLLVDCQDEESIKWKPVACPSKLTEKSTSLDYLCISHATSGFYLTFDPSSENFGPTIVLKEFDENSGDQLFNLTDVKRCCQITSQPDFKGNGTEICLGLTQSDQDYLVLPEVIEPVASVRCWTDVHLVGFEGRNYSGAAYVIAEGTEISFSDASVTTRLLSFYVQSVCGRIFASPNLTGDYTSVCGGISNLGDKFIGKNVSVLIADRALEIFDGPDFTGNSTILRRTMMNLQDWSYSLVSARFSQ